MSEAIRHSIGKEKAIELAATNWWELCSHREIAEFQLFTVELCCPFAVFHEAVEKSLGRPVWTHEFGLNHDGIVAEFLGEKDAPTMDEIINLLPEGWTDVEHMQSWLGHTHAMFDVEIGRDTDGDIGIIDRHGYSIILHKSEALRLRDWLNRFIEKENGE